MTPRRGVEFGGEGMGYMLAYRRMWQNFARCDGRAGLAEYWKPTLIDILVAIVFSILDRAVSALVPAHHPYAVAAIPPSLGLAFPSLHDTGRSGWWWLVGPIPILGWLCPIHLPARLARGRAVRPGGELSPGGPAPHSPAPPGSGRPISAAGSRGRQPSEEAEPGIRRPSAEAEPGIRRLHLTAGYRVLGSAGEHGLGPLPDPAGQRS
ncbi:MAG: DUF805 domain-containing protein [Candidatus Dormibacteria bacterium]